MSKEPRSAYYRWCIVLECENTSIRTPEKTFIQVPHEEKRKKQWFAAARRDFTTISKTSSVFICEDHFDLENDMENYVKWKLTGGVKKMKKTAVPHKFDRRSEIKREISSAPKSAAVKRNKMQLVEELLGVEISKILTNATTNTQTEEFVELLKTENSRVNARRRDVGITVKPHFRSKQTQTSVPVMSHSCSPFKITDAQLQSHQ